MIERYGLEKRSASTFKRFPPRPRSPRSLQSSREAPDNSAPGIGRYAVRMRTAGTKVMGIGPVMKWANTVAGLRNQRIVFHTPELKAKKSV